jgi:hypothetical protein
MYMVYLPDSVALIKYKTKTIRKYNGDKTANSLSLQRSAKLRGTEKGHHFITFTERSVSIEKQDRTTGGYAAAQG